MEKLFQRFYTKLKNVSTDFTRYLYHDIVWEDRLISVKGARGVGKTTLLFQYIKKNLALDNTTLYLSMDDIYFQINTLVDLVEAFYLNGGKHLFLDEVHKYPNWSIEIKNIYDTYSDLQIVFTSSSVLEINKGDADLSRRAVTYELKGLSFREYLWLEHKLKYEPISLETLLTDHLKIATDITSQIKVYPAFKKYLQSGYYPFYKEGQASYASKLNTVVNLILETDIPSVYGTEYKTIYKLKKLLYVIATSVPFQPNISKLSERIDTSSRSSTLQYLDYLEKANLIATLKVNSGGNNYMMKPDKIYLDNTNLVYCIGNSQEVEGNVRETFFINQLACKHKVNTSRESDFVIDDIYTFEVGGKNKNASQINVVTNAFIAADNIEFGFQNKIPLYLFGFLY